MKKNAQQALAKTDYSTSVQIAINNQIATLTIRSINSGGLPGQLLFKPLCYLAKDSSEVGFTFYAFVVVPEKSTLGMCAIQQVNAYNMVEIVLNYETSAIGKEQLFFIEIVGMPPPLGYKVTSVELNVRGVHTPSAKDDPETPPQGEGRTAVDYQDADEEIN